MEMNAVQALLLIVGVTLGLSIPAWLWERYQAWRADPLDKPLSDTRRDGWNTKR